MLTYRKFTLKEQFHCSFIEVSDPFEVNGLKYVAYHTVKNLIVSIDEKKNQYSPLWDKQYVTRTKTKEDFDNEMKLDPFVEDEIYLADKYMKEEGEGSNSLVCGIFDGHPERDMNKRFAYRYGEGQTFIVNNSNRFEWCTVKHVLGITIAIVTLYGKTEERIMLYHKKADSFDLDEWNYENDHFVRPFTCPIIEYLCDKMKYQEDGYLVPFRNAGVLLFSSIVDGIIHCEAFPDLRIIWGDHDFLWVINKDDHAVMTLPMLLLMTSMKNLDFEYWKTVRSCKLIGKINDEEMDIDESFMAQPYIFVNAKKSYHKNKLIPCRVHKEYVVFKKKEEREAWLQLLSGQCTCKKK